MDFFLFLGLSLIFGGYLLQAGITHFELLALREKVRCKLKDACSSLQVETATLQDLERAARNAGNHEKQVHLRTNARWSDSAKGRRGRGRPGIQFSHQQNNFANLHAPQVFNDIGLRIIPQREHVDRSVEAANEAIREYNTLRLSFWYLVFREILKPFAYVTPRGLAGSAHHAGPQKPKSHRKAKSKNRHPQKRTR